jgi:hypothetical protein
MDQATYEDELDKTGIDQLHDNVLKLSLNFAR